MDDSRFESPKAPSLLWIIISVLCPTLITALGTISLAYPTHDIFWLQVLVCGGLGALWIYAILRLTRD